VLCVIWGFLRQVARNCDLIGYHAVSSGHFLPTFRHNLSVPGSRIPKKASDNFSPLLAFSNSVYDVTPVCSRSFQQYKVNQSHYSITALDRPLGFQEVEASRGNTPGIHFYWGTRWRSWLGHCATNRNVAGWIPDSLTGFFHWHNPSSRTMVLESTQPLTEMSTRNISWG
jgi:hypothetical protein